MVDGLDMTLEDLVNKNNRTKKLQDGNSGGRGSYPDHHRSGDTHRSGDLRSRAPRTKLSSMNQVQWCPAPYFFIPPPPPPRPYFMPPLPPPPPTRPYFMPPLPPPPPPPPELNMRDMEVGSKLYLSNLHYSVTEDDLKVLFSDVGPLKECAIHYDVSGRSEGTAEVVFEDKFDALKARRQYNNLPLDGMPLKIELVGVDISTSPYPPAPKGIAGGMDAPSGPWKIEQNYMGPYGVYTPPPTEGTTRNGAGTYGNPKWFRARKSGRPGPLPDWNKKKINGREERSSKVQGRECPQKRVRNPRVSAEALDADLDKYLQDKR